MKANWTYSVGPGTMKGHTRAVTLQKMKEAYTSVSAISKFTATLKTSGRADIRFYFKTNAQMEAQNRKEGRSGIPLGLAWKNGTVWLNKDRPVRDYHIFALTIHESRHVWARNTWHSKDRTSIMHADLSARVMNAVDIRWCVRAFGTKPKPKPSCDPIAAKLTKANKDYAAAMALKTKLRSQTRANDAKVRSLAKLVRDTKRALKKCRG